MKRSGRGLTPAEAALWARVAQTVSPLEGRTVPRAPADVAALSAPARTAGRAVAPIAPPPSPAKPDRSPRPPERHGLDASWDRKLARGAVSPDFTLDLHGASLDAAYVRLDHGLTQALAQGARVVLLIIGRQRLSDDHASRGSRRGAIRAKFMDWLSAGAHGGRIAAIRPAHPRHGGAGAVYLILRKVRP